MARTLRVFIFPVVILPQLLALASAKPTTKPRLQADFVEYLKRYGYLQEYDSRLGRMRTDKDIGEAVKKIQTLLNLTVTGDLSDTQTVAIMKKKRCGMPDFGPSDNASRSRRYATQKTVWKKQDLTYKIVNYTPDLTKGEVDQTIDKAIAMWANVSSLTFTKITHPCKEADIMIKFVRGCHGDSRPADGKGRELAHAFSPLNNTGLAGDVHFDEDETFTLFDVAGGVDLLWLAVHELGHSLGLEHAYHPDSVMFPFYFGYRSNLQLDADDENGIQSIYGMPTVEWMTPTPHTERVPGLPGLPKKCSATVDAIVTTQNKGTWLFSGEHVWEIDDNGAGEAQKIKNVFPNLEGNIDAAYTSKKQGHTFFFKGTTFSVYNNHEHVYGPTDIKELGLPSQLENMDAALEWGRNGKPYFFKGNKYWRFNPTRNSMDPGYPRDIARAWKGLPGANIDGALQWKNGNSYFFKGKEYYAFDDRWVRVKHGYPRDVATYWMGCGPVN